MDLAIGKQKHDFFQVLDFGQNFLFEFNSLRPFGKKMDSSNSKQKQDFFQVLDFGQKIEKKIAVAHPCLGAPLLSFPPTNFKMGGAGHLPPPP